MSAVTASVFLPIAAVVFPPADKTCFTLESEPVSRSMNQIENYRPSIGQFYTFLLVMLVLTDILFVSLHIFYYMKSDDVEWTYSPYKNLFNIVYDGSYPEAYNYLKFFWCGIICISYSIKIRNYGFVLVGFVFWLFMADDMFKFHERSGKYFSQFIEFNPIFGLRMQDYGELTYAILIGVPIFMLFGLLILFSQSKIRRQLATIALLIMSLGFFGVVMDLFHEIIGEIGRNVKFAFGVVEDGGEMIVASLMLSYLYRIHVGLLR